jgi:hypothetical protein
VTPTIRAAAIGALCALLAACGSPVSTAGREVPLTPSATRSATPTPTPSPTAASRATTAVQVAAAAPRPRVTTLARAAVPRTPGPVKVVVPAPVRKTVTAAANAPAASAHYANCAAVRAAGAAPLLRGQAGYSSALDRDGDGVACET